MLCGAYRSTIGVGHIMHNGAEASLGARPIAHPMEMTEEVYPVLCVVSACALIQRAC